MGSINEIFRVYYPDYAKKFGAKVPLEHQKVANAIMDCSTGHYGTCQYQCSDCQHIHTINNGCGNRHCPGCQQYKSYQWADVQKSKLLPSTNYFMVTFTVPSEIRSFIRSNQRACYAAMFHAASETIRVLLKDQKFLGVDTTGFLAMLHTSGRSLTYHPHVHFIVPAGGIQQETKKWIGGRADYLFSEKAAGKIFKAKFYHEMKKASLKFNFDPSLHPKGWIVDVELAGKGEKVIDYLSRYIYRVPISNHRIVSNENDKVVFKYRPSGKQKLKTMTLPAFEFLRRFLQHVLPTGFMRVRHYGFLSGASKKLLEEIRNSIDELYCEVTSINEKTKCPEYKRHCENCDSTNLKLINFDWRPKINSSA